MSLPGSLPERSPLTSSKASPELDAKAWRRKLEDEEIERYLHDFGKVGSLASLLQSVVVH